MAITLYFSENKGKGVQLSADAMDMFQRATKLVENAFVCMMGNNGIVCGVEETAPGAYNPGIIIYNGELLYFEGGEIENYISITEETTECFFCSNTKERIWTIRTAKFSVLGPGLAVTEGLPELYRPDYTFFTLDAQVVQNTTDIAEIQDDIVEIQEDIFEMQENITNLQTKTEIVNIQNAIFEVGDTMYVKNITDFDGNGVGTVGTKRENWCLVHPGNFLWRTALGLPGGTTFNDVDGRVLVSAGTKYAALSMFGIDSAILSAANLPPHVHKYFDSFINAIDGSAVFSSVVDLHATVLGVQQGPIANSGIQISEGNGVGDDDRDAVWYDRDTGDGTDSLNTAKRVGNGAGAAAAHENRQPSLALYLMVKYQ